jgi:hypothetical protein
MLLVLGLLLIILWVVLLASKITVGIVHVALVAGLILFLVHFVRGRRTTASRSGF